MMKQASLDFRRNVLAKKGIVLKMELDKSKVIIYRLDKELNDVYR